jgi:hypothetical protein
VSSEEAVGEGGGAGINRLVVVTGEGRVIEEAEEAEEGGMVIEGSGEERGRRFGEKTEEGAGKAKGELPFRGVPESRVERQKELKKRDREGDEG